MIGDHFWFCRSAAWLTTPGLVETRLSGGPPCGSVLERRRDFAPDSGPGACLWLAARQTPAAAALSSVRGDADCQRRSIEVPVITAPDYQSKVTTTSAFCWRRHAWRRAIMSRRGTDSLVLFSIFTVCPPTGAKPAQDPLRFGDARSLDGRPRCLGDQNCAAWRSEYQRRLGEMREELRGIAYFLHLDQSRMPGACSGRARHRWKTGNISSAVIARDLFSAERMRRSCGSLGVGSVALWWLCRWAWRQSI